MNHRTGPVLAFPLLLLVMACATVPITGRTQLMLLPDDTIIQASADAYALFMAAAAQQGATVLSASESPEAAALLRTVASVTERVVVAAGLAGWRNWDAIVLKTSAQNAYVMPHGKIVVFEGLLAVTQNEAQLAAVIGHEVAHLVARHAAERLSQVLAAQAVVNVAYAALARSQYQPLIGAALGLGIQYGILLPYSREHESEADHIGLFYVAKAGYDPSEAVTLWERMEASSGSETWNILTDHPSPTKRKEQLQKWLPEAMLYFADPFRRLPSNLVEVRQAVADHASENLGSPIGLRPSRKPGFWLKVKLSNRNTVDTFRLDRLEPCFSTKCLLYTSDTGDTVTGTEDQAWVAAASADGTWLRYDPPLQLLRWPLRVGDTSSGVSTMETSAGERLKVAWKVNIVSYEPVTVPAGAFMAFHVILSINGNRFQDIWWAPDARNSVRTVTPDGRGGMIVGELVDYEKSADPTGQLSGQR